MNARSIWAHYSSRRSVASVEWAIKSFLAITDPVQAAEVALYMQRTGENGPQRFVWLCEGYRRDPGAWRREERAWHRRRREEQEIRLYGWHSRAPAVIAGALR
jgi:hypothetical protein